MSIFDAYDAEFGSLKDEVLKNIAGLKEDLANNENPLPLFKLVDGLFMQSHDLIKQMELEARSNDSAMRKKMNETVVGYKKSLQTMKADFQTCRAQHDRAQLGTGKSSEQRQRLLDTTDR
jgi:multidrug resistance efflux pump